MESPRNAADVAAINAQPAPWLEPTDGGSGGDRGEDQAGGTAQPQRPSDLRHASVEQSAPAQVRPQLAQHRVRAPQHATEAAAADPSPAVSGYDQGRPQLALPGGADGGGIDAAEPQRSAAPSPHPYRSPVSEVDQGGAHL